MNPILQFHGISKGFHGIPVLKDISFSVPDGGILGLVGENGAGKSTLMNLLGGNLQPDRGSMTLAGAPFAPRSPAEATRAGVAFVHQELNLFPNLSIAENLFLDRLPRRFRGLPFLDRRRMHERASSLLGEVGLNQPPETLVERLSAGERQLLEIARALGRDARVLLLDEPTTSLTAVEAGRLFELLLRLRQRGLSMVYISHGLADVLRLADEVVVLRDGAVVDQAPACELTVNRLVTRMVGRELTQLFPPREGQPGTEVLLEAKGLSHPGILRQVSFQLRRGEILGFSGLMGAGRSELARILFGLDPCEHGTLHLEGHALHTQPTRERIRRGMAFLTEDRRGDGLQLEASIADNLRLVSLPRWAHGPWRWLDDAASAEALRQVRSAVHLTPTARDTQPVRTLSGGNQQKVVLAKWLLHQPKVILLDEPTRGIDVGARYEIYRLIQDLAQRGAGILVISSEVEELMGLCDRILVMRRGEIRGALERAEFDRERILGAAVHAEAAP